MRPLTFLQLAAAAALGFGAIASCDTGGEPPAGPDAALADSPVNDTNIDTHRPPPDVHAGDAAISDATGDGPCGTSGNACCTGEAPACITGTTCKDNVCEPPCGKPGQPCCGKERKCNGAASVCNSHDFCTACGGSGESCCALNVCNSGGCCVGDLCSPEGTICVGSDGGTCMSGGCGTCGSPGQPCCASGCTAPQTVCQGGVAGFDGGEGGGGTSGTPGDCAGCGGPGQPCCTGASCESSLMCNGSDICICVTSSCGEADAGAGG